MEFERIKLINEYKTDPPISAGTPDGEIAPPNVKDDDKPVFVDYM